MKDNTILAFEESKLLLPPEKIAHLTLDFRHRLQAINLRVEEYLTVAGGESTPGHNAGHCALTAKPLIIRTTLLKPNMIHLS